MTTNKQESNNVYTVISSTDTIHEIKNRSHRFLPLDPYQFSIPNEEDEADLEETIDVENESPSPPIRQSSNVSTEIKTRPIKKYSSRLYKFLQLEQALKSAHFFKNKHDQIKFEHEYRESLHENKFEIFLQTYYKKLQIYKDTIEQESNMKTSRTFTFVDLEKNFLALDPTRDIKIEFINRPTTSSTPDIKNNHSDNSIYRNSTASIHDEDAAVEAFYEKRFHRLLRDPSRARDEITLFARQAGEHLHQRFPCLSHVPYRVKVIDEREKEGHLDERTLLQMKHKHNLFVIEKRRQLIMKMMIQAKRNQNKMKQLDRRTPLTMDNLTYCQELLEKINHIEQILKQEQIKHPRIDYIPRNMTSYSLSQTTTTTIPRTTSSLTSQSTPYQDAFSINQVEKTTNVHVIQPTRCLTAPVKKLNWINYC
ncbi:unnamed protein product [Adineta steineri]|uniref:Uncharacterized protein n=1 Tax=Adineta steineri TaxID=433720 RepID=A0A819TKX9_9BILA|nr:unnamed protein product [Adineta steineri]